MQRQLQVRHTHVSQVHCASACLHKIIESSEKNIAPEGCHDAVRAPFLIPSYPAKGHIRFEQNFGTYKTFLSVAASSSPSVSRERGTFPASSEEACSPSKPCTTTRQDKTSCIPRSGSAKCRKAQESPTQFYFGMRVGRQSRT